MRGGVPYCLVATLEWGLADRAARGVRSAEGRATAADAARPAEPAPVRRVIVTVEEDVLQSAPPAVPIAKCGVSGGTRQRSVAL